MRNIYIETDANFRVTKIHTAPFDPNNGMGYTREELEKKGFFVEEIPTPANKIGRRAISMYNPDTKSIYYEYVNIPMSDKERADMLENALNWLMSTLGIGSYSTMTMRLDLDEEAPKLSASEEGAAKYLAYQVIAGKLDAFECLNSFPQFADYIKSVLKDNGIQV